MTNLAVKLGCDPEVFLRQAGGKKLFIPSCGLFGGEKKKPRIINEEYGVGILEDNVTLEFNINPVDTSGQFRTAVMQAYTNIQEEAAKHGLVPHITSSATFSQEDLKKFPQAMVFGCDPDNDAWKEGRERQPPDPIALGGWRFAGEHVHFGYDKSKLSTPEWAIVQFLDVFVTAWKSSYYRDDSMRRQYYGLPGLFRVKEYGLEYRTPSFWLAPLVFDGDNSFVADCQRVVAAVINNEKELFRMYEKIDWKMAHERMSKPHKGNTAEMAYSMWLEQIRPLRDEVLVMGRDAIGESKPADGALARMFGNMNPVRINPARPAPRAGAMRLVRGPNGGLIAIDEPEAPPAVVEAGLDDDLLGLGDDEGDDL